jgi:hypothetical protein
VSASGFHASVLSLCDWLTAASSAVPAPNDMSCQAVGLRLDGQPAGLRGSRVVAAMRSAEDQAWSADGVEGVALRSGLFYRPAGAIQGLIEPLRRRLPVPRGGGGTMSLPHQNHEVRPTR